MRKPDLAELFMDIHDTMAKALLQIIAQGVAQGVFRPTAQTLETARFVLDLIESCSCRKAVENDHSRNHEKDLIDFIFAALETRTAL